MTLRSRLDSVQAPPTEADAAADPNHEPQKAAVDNTALKNSPKPVGGKETEPDAWNEIKNTRSERSGDSFDELSGKTPTVSAEDYGWYIRQGRAALEGGQLERARSYFQTALEAKPSAGEALSGLGTVASRQGRTSLATRYFRSATQRNYPEAFFDLAQAYRKSGDVERARAAYFTYTKRLPQGLRVADAKRAIAELGQPINSAPTRTESP
ncbi:MAG: tetratricopeptide repeat protein [Polyangiales bacterium]